MDASSRQIARRGVMALLCAATLVAVPIAAARAACTWVESVTDWDGTIAWSYSHHASWNEFSNTYDGRTSDQVSLSGELDASFLQAIGPLDGTASIFTRLDATPPEGLPGYTQFQGSGPVDAYAPPPLQMYLFLDSQNCSYTFSYDPLGVSGTSTVKSGCCTNSVPAIDEPGSLSSGLQTIPETSQALSFSGPVAAIAEGVPPFAEAFYTPPEPAYGSAYYLGDMQLGAANVQWSFQPGGTSQPVNDACAGARSIGGWVQDVSAATTAASDPTPTCGDGDRSVWFLVQAAEAGVATVDTQGSDYGTIVSVWPMAEACGALATQVSCGNDAATWVAEAGETYRVQVTRGSGGASGLVVTATVPEPAGAISFAAAALALGALRARESRA